MRWTAALLLAIGCFISVGLGACAPYTRFSFFEIGKRESGGIAATGGPIEWGSEPTGKNLHGISFGPAFRVAKLQDQDLDTGRAYYGGFFQTRYYLWRKVSFQRPAAGDALGAPSCGVSDSGVKRGRCAEWAHEWFALGVLGEVGRAKYKADHEVGRDILGNAQAERVSEDLTAYGAMGFLRIGTAGGTVYGAVRGGYEGSSEHGGTAA